MKQFIRIIHTSAQAHTRAHARTHARTHTHTHTHTHARTHHHPQHTHLHGHRVYERTKSMAYIKYDLVHKRTVVRRTCMRPRPGGGATLSLCPGRIVGRRICLAITSGAPDASCPVGSDGRCVSSTIDGLPAPVDPLGRRLFSS